MQVREPAIRYICLHIHSQGALQRQTDIERERLEGEREGGGERERGGGGQRERGGGGERGSSHRQNKEYQSMLRPHLMITICKMSGFGACLTCPGNIRIIVKNVIWNVHAVDASEECCACFGLYSDDIGTGREWLECACGRWLHEDCVENIVYDTNGKEKLCPLCLSVV